MSIAKCADDYHIDYNKPATLSLHAMCRKTIPFNYPLKELIVLFCQGCRDNAIVLVAQQAQNSTKSHFSSSTSSLQCCVIDRNFILVP